MRTLFLSIFILLTACTAKPVQDKKMPSPLISASTFLTEETKALQADEFSNPGFLWVESGKKIFQQDCQSCHNQNGEMREAAKHYPLYDSASDKVINIENRINLCRTEQMDATALPYESEPLLALTSYIRHQARGKSQTILLDTKSQKHFDKGEIYFFARRGQFNLSCSQCHNNYWGQKLRGDTISQGHGNGFPAYRFEWESLGSLHRRFADCDRGVRAEPKALGSDEYSALEFYLAHRAGNLPIETPAVRR